MADQRELHDIEQVVPAIFDADIADGYQARGGRLWCTPPRRISGSNRSRSQQVPVWELMKLGECQGFLRTFTGIRAYCGLI